MYLLAVFVAIVVSQTPPQLSSDFTASVEFEDFRDRHFPGTWYSDSTGKRDRFDSEVPHLGRLDWWKFWNTTSGGTEYAYDEGKQECAARLFKEPFFGPFDYLKRAVMSSKPCDEGSILWSYHTTGLLYDACISKDGKTPVWIEKRELPDFHVFVRFHTYRAGRPDASQYVLPKECH
jgi:hypothetical protein